MAPAPQVDDPLTPGGPDPCRHPGVVEDVADLVGQGPAVAGFDAEGGVAVGADHLGDGAAGGGHQGDAGRHGLDGWQGEALVQRGDHRHLGLGVELHDPLVGHPRHEGDHVLQPQRGDGAGRLPALLGAADDGEGDLGAFGAQLGHRLEQVAEALHRHVGAGGGDEHPGPAFDLGLWHEQLGVDADGHDVHAVGVDLVVGDDVVEGVFRHRDHPGQAAGHLGLHVGEGVPAAQGQLLVEALGVFDLQAAVDGDRVVDGGDDRQAHPFDGQQAEAEGLVVVHQVEVALAVLEVVPGPHGEGQRLGEGAEREGRHLEEVLPVLDLPHARHAHREVLVVDVEAGEGDKGYPLVQFGVGLTAQDLHVVAQIDEGLGQVAHVHALASAVRLAAVGEDGDAQR